MLCVRVYMYMCGSWFRQELAMCHALAASRTRCAEPRCVSMNNTMNECKQRDSGGKESMQIDNAQCHSSPVEHLRCAVQNTQIAYIFQKLILNRLIFIHHCLPFFFLLWMNPAGLLNKLMNQISLCPFLHTFHFGRSVLILKAHLGLGIQSGCVIGSEIL